MAAWKSTTTPPSAALRAVMPGRKNCLFAGADVAAYPRDRIARIADHEIPRIDELLPWNWTGAADGTGNANVAWLGGRLPGNRQADQRVSGGVIIG